MCSRGMTSWSEREEANLLSWLDENRDLPWKAIPGAYSEAFGVDRSVESLRGKKYHILRKKKRAKTAKHQTRRKRSNFSRSAAKRASQSDARAGAAAQSIDRWLQTILTSDPILTDNHGSTVINGSTSDYLTPVLTNSFPKQYRTLSWIWEYVDRVCAAGTLNLEGEHVFKPHRKND